MLRCQGLAMLLSGQAGAWSCRWLTNQSGASGHVISGNQWQEGWARLGLTLHSAPQDLGVNCALYSTLSASTFPPCVHWKQTVGIICAEPLLCDLYSLGLTFCVSKLQILRPGRAVYAALRCRMKCRNKNLRAAAIARGNGTAGNKTLRHNKYFLVLSTVHLSMVNSNSKHNLQNFLQSSFAVQNISNYSKRWRKSVNVVSWSNIVVSKHSGKFPIINILSVLTAFTDNVINVLSLKRAVSHIEENFSQLRKSNVPWTFSVKKPDNQNG